MYIQILYFRLSLLPLYVVKDCVRYPAMVDLESRLSTFPPDWEGDVPDSDPRQVALGGHFYSHPRLSAPRTTCFACGFRWTWRGRGRAAAAAANRRRLHFSRECAYFRNALPDSGSEVVGRGSSPHLGWLCCLATTGIFPLASVAFLLVSVFSFRWDRWLWEMGITVEFVVSAAMGVGRELEFQEELAESGSPWVPTWFGLIVSSCAILFYWAAGHAFAVEAFSPSGAGLAAVARSGLRRLLHLSAGSSFGERLASLSVDVLAQAYMAAAVCLVARYCALEDPAPGMTCAGANAVFFGAGDGRRLAACALACVLPAAQVACFVAAEMSKSSGGSYDVSVEECRSKMEAAGKVSTWRNVYVM